MFKIGIISDTHSKIKRAYKAIDLLVEQKVDFLIHAGDIVKVEVLEYMKQQNTPYIAVYGNNDKKLYSYHKDYNLVQEPHYFNFKKTSFKLMHLPYYMSPDASIVIFGHTHEYEVQMVGKTLFLNSGEVCARNYDVSSCVLLEVDNKYFNVNRWTRKVKSDKWSVEKTHFNRGL